VGLSKGFTWSTPDERGGGGTTEGSREELGREKVESEIKIRERPEAVGTDLETRIRRTRGSEGGGGSILRSDEGEGTEASVSGARGERGRRRATSGVSRRAALVVEKLIGSAASSGGSAGLVRGEVEAGLRRRSPETEG
jgi:hypothetical protein